MRLSIPWVFALILTPFAAMLHVGAHIQPSVPLEILSFKVGSDYYPLLDGKSPVVSADSSDYPKPESEKIYRDQGRRRSSTARMEELKARGRMSSRIQVISDASFVKTEFKNTGEKPIRSIDWDFAFPRFDGDQIALRFGVSSKVEIKPGAKKALKQQLPVGASKCKVIHLSADDLKAEKGKVFDSVCGQGIHDGSHLNQETISIKRIEYVDGSVWMKP